MLLSTIILNHDKRDLTSVIESVKFSDEIIILNDATEPNINHQIFSNVQEIYRPLSGDFSAQRNFALKQAKGDWVLFLDSDELVSAGLEKDIKDAIKSNIYRGYYLRRLDSYYGVTLKHGETGNIKIIRLARKDSGHFIRPVHEIWKISGSVSLLRSPINHLRSDLTAGFISRMMLYGPIDAEALIKEGKGFSCFRLLAYPKAKFILNYIFKFGFLDGLLGLFHAYLMSIQSLTVRVYQWERKNT